jgi:hypothetical protein
MNAAATLGPELTTASDSRTFMRTCGECSNLQPTMRMRVSRTSAVVGLREERRADYSEQSA